MTIVFALMVGGCSLYGVSETELVGDYKFDGVNGLPAILILNSNHTFQLICSGDKNDPQTGSWWLDKVNDNLQVHVSRYPKEPGDCYLLNEGQPVVPVRDVPEGINLEIFGGREKYVKESI